ncbi:MAG TPA: hypothetical protein VK826_00235 [Bacteroidia bacterium]|nr:hypothetical protein [Bacteroidia bacterium]
MEKIIVHTIRITRSFEKNLFQILLPENAESITGIAASCDIHLVNVTGQPKIQRESGYLHLFISDTGEKMFAQILHASYRIEAWEKIGEQHLVIQQFSWKTNFEMLATCQPVQNMVIDGFYEDRVGADVEEDELSYNVRIYLRLKMKQP